MNEVVKFVLDKYGIAATWRIIPLDLRIWAKLPIETRTLDILASEAGKQLENLLTSELGQRLRAAKDEHTPLMEEVLRKRKEAMEMGQKVSIEYGRDLDLEENLYSRAMCFHISELKKKSNFLKKFRKMLPTHYKLLKRNSDVDFIILLNSHIISESSLEENQKTAAHETLHHVQRLTDSRSDFQTIDDLADRIVTEFNALKKKENQ